MKKKLIIKSLSYIICLLLVFGTTVDYGMISVDAAYNGEAIYIKNIDGVDYVIQEFLRSGAFVVPANVTKVDVTVVGGGGGGATSPWARNYGGGGGGGNSYNYTGYPGGTGGTGGGGRGGKIGENGAPNTGGGGGGGHYAFPSDVKENGGAGGSGIVIVRWLLNRTPTINVTSPSPNGTLQVQNFI